MTNKHNPDMPVMIWATSRDGAPIWWSAGLKSPDSIQYIRADISQSQINGFESLLDFRQQEIAVINQQINVLQEEIGLQKLTIEAHNDTIERYQTRYEQHIIHHNEHHKKEDIIINAAHELIQRWDTPNWKDTPATAVFIDKLRYAVSLFEGE